MSILSFRDGRGDGDAHGPATGLAEISRMASEAVEGWLRDYDGYRGLLIFTDEGAQTSRVVTLWETAEAEGKARSSRGAMRDQIAAQAGMELVEFGVWEVAVLELTTASEHSTEDDR